MCISSFTYTGLYFKIKTVKIHKIVVLYVGICIYKYKLVVSQYGPCNRDVHIEEDSLLPELGLKII